MGDPAHVPQLQENAAPGLVHGGDHLFPSCHLLRAVDTGRVGVTVAAGRDGGGLRDDQPGGGPLAVILRVHFRGDMALGRPAPGERRHQDTMRELHGAQLQGIEEIGHEVCKISGQGLVENLCFISTP